MSYLFISYAREDNEFARTLNTDIQDCGIQTWIDESGIRGGEDWLTSIASAIESSAGMLVILTPASVKSKWVNREISFADHLDKKIVPLLFKPCNLSSLYDLEFGRIQRVDFTDMNYQGSFQKLLISLKDVLGLSVELTKPHRHNEDPYQIAVEKITEARVKDLPGLFLDGINLSEIPKELYNLKDIDNLDVSRNKLTKIPIEIGQFTSLKSIHLDSNKFSEIPIQLFQLIHLTHLYLNDNAISDLPPEIGLLTHLEMLHLSNNPFSTLPPELGLLTNLTHLYLNNNRLISLPSKISQLKNLTQLYLYDNELQVLPEQIRELSNLSWLGIAGNKIKEVPSWIGDLINLETLVIGTGNYQKVSIPILPPEIGNLTNLKRLDLVNLSLSKLPVEMKKLLSLQILRLDGNPNLNIRPRILREAHRPEVIIDYYFKNS